MFPADAAGFGIDNQYFLGSSGLLTHPVVKQGETSATLYLADEEVDTYIRLALEHSLVQSFLCRSLTTTTSHMLCTHVHHPPAPDRMSRSLLLWARSLCCITVAPFSLGVT